MTLLAVGSVALIPIEWRKRRPYDAAFQLNKTVVGERTARAIRRSLPSGAGVLCSMEVGLVLDVVRSLVVVSDGVVEAVAGVVFVGFLSFTIAVIAVVLVNSPKWLVPPHLRGEAGLLGKRR